MAPNFRGSQVRRLVTYQNQVSLLVQFGDVCHRRQTTHDHPLHRTPVTFRSHRGGPNSTQGRISPNPGKFRKSRFRTILCVLFQSRQRIFIPLISFIQKTLGVTSRRTELPKNFMYTGNSGKIKNGYSIHLSSLKNSDTCVLDTFPTRISFTSWFIPKKKKVFSF